MKLRGERRCPVCLQSMPKKPAKCPRCGMKTCMDCAQKHAETHYVKIRF